MARPSKQEQARVNRNRAVRTAIVVVVGIGLGYLCPTLPFNYQQICHLAAKLVGFLAGGSP